MTEQSRDMTAVRTPKTSIRKRILFGIVLFALLFAVAVSLTVCWGFLGLSSEHFKEDLEERARIVISAVSGDAVRDYLKTNTRDESYEDTSQFLHSLVDATDLTRIMIFCPQEKDSILLWDTDDPNAFGRHEEYNDDAKFYLKAFSRTPENISISYNSPQGTVQAVYMPIFDSQGEPAALLGLEQPPFDLKGVFMRFIVAIVVTALLVTAVMILLVYRAINRSLIRPIGILTDNAKKIVSNLRNKEEIRFDIHTNDELQTLADTFSSMNLDLREYISKLSEVTAEKERIDAELELASKIQASFLPKLVPPYTDNQAFSLFGSMDPAKEVGGDFYDFFMVDDTHIALVIADVSGKGLAAALFMVVCKILIRDGFDTSLSPASVLNLVNSKLMESNDTGFFVTAWVAVIDLSTGEGVSVNAGHENPAFREGDYPFEYIRYKHSAPIAAFETVEWYERHFTLDPGDVIFVYTDGATDALNSAKEQFGEDRLIAAINQTRELSLEDQVHAVKAAIDAFAGEEPQFDDITMLAFRYEGNGDCSKGKSEPESLSHKPKIV